MTTVIGISGYSAKLIRIGAIDTSQDEERRTSPVKTRQMTPEERKQYGLEAREYVSEQRL